MLASRRTDSVRLPNIYLAVEKQSNVLNAGEELAVLPPINRCRPSTEEIYTPSAVSASKSCRIRSRKYKIAPFSPCQDKQYKSENAESAESAENAEANKLETAENADKSEIFNIEDTSSQHRQDYLDKYPISKSTTINIYTPDEHPEYFSKEKGYLGDDAIVRCASDEAPPYLTNRFDSAHCIASNTPPSLPFSYKNINYQLIPFPSSNNTFENMYSNAIRNIKIRTTRCIECNTKMSLLNCITTNCKHVFCYDCIETYIARIWMKMVMDNKTDTSIICSLCSVPITHIIGYNERELTKMREIYVSNTNKKTPLYAIL